MTYVVDASVAVEYLLRTPTGQSLASVVADAELVAPELLDAEVLAVLRRACLAGRLTEERADLAIEDLLAWPVERITHRALVLGSWQVRHNVTAYDALYVATANLFGVPLLTADGPLSRAPSLGIAVHNVRAAPRPGA